MLIEAEAKTKWCPFVRFAEDGGTFNRGTLHGPLNIHDSNAGTSCNCIASDCMAWRSGGTVRVDSAGKRVFGETHQFKERIEIGYCGLAGHPEAQS